MTSTSTITNKAYTALVVGVDCAASGVIVVVAITKVRRPMGIFFLLYRSFKKICEVKNIHGVISVVKKIITPSARQQNANEHHANHDYTRLDWLCAGARGTRRVHGVACWLYAVAVAVGAQGRRRVALGILSSSLMTLLFFWTGITHSFVVYIDVQ